MIFYALLFLMFFGDMLWCRAALRQPRRWVRWMTVAFGMAQFAGLAGVLLSRFGLPLEEALPRWTYSAILSWHLVILLPWLAWRFLRLLIVLATKAARAMRRSAPSAPADGLAMNRREFIGTAAAFTPPLLSFGAAGLGEAQLDGFRIRRIEVPLAQLPQALDGMTIAHLSDFHVGRFTRGRVLERIVEETNRLDADVIALTGDFINHSLRDLPATIEIVRALRARHAIVGCEGNHDLIENAHAFRRDAARGGIPLLLGDIAGATIQGQKVQFLGIPWTHGDDAARREIAALLARRDPSAWPLLLAHHPHAWDSAGDIPLTLSGHTHGGQLMLNERLGVGPVLFRYWSGLYRRAGSALVVSNGVGNWFPVRVQAPAEILHLTLRRSAEGA